MRISILRSKVRFSVLQMYLMNSFDHSSTHYESDNKSLSSNKRPAIYNGSHTPCILVLLHLDFFTDIGRMKPAGSSYRFSPFGPIIQ